MKVSFVNKVKFHIKKLYRKAKLPGDDSSQKMPSCTCLKASYTLEAAVIFPLVAGFFVFILFSSGWFRWSHRLRLLCIIHPG